MLKLKGSISILFLILMLPIKAVADVWVAPLDEGEVKYKKPPMYIEVDSQRVNQFLPNSEEIPPDRTSSNLAETRVSVTKSGPKPDESSVGNQVPLEEAIKAILPGDDWLINYDGSVDKNMPVKWKSSGGWADILRDISEKNSVSIAVNKKDDVVGVSDDPNYAVLLSSPDADIQGIVSAKNGGVPAAEVGIGNLKPGAKVWYFDKSKTVGENLTDWASRTDWEVTWEYPKDYMPKASAQYVGTFKEAARQLMYTLAGAGYPIGAVANSKNKVLRIRGIK